MTRPQVEQYLASPLVRYKGGGVADDLFGRDHESIHDMVEKTRVDLTLGADVNIEREVNI